MKVSRGSWHFKFYNWFNEGKLPNIIDLCSYCRTVMFWTPLKVLCLPAMWLHQKSKWLSYLVLILLVGVVDAVLILINTGSAGWWLSYTFTVAVLYLFLYLPRLRKTVASDWDEAEDTKFVRYTTGAGRVIGTGLKYSVGLPVKTIFWTIWAKMYDFNKVIFWSVLCLVVAAIFFGFYVIGWWLPVLIAIGILALMVLLGGLLVLFLEKKGASLGDSLIWQFLVAQKRKICPFIEPKD